MSEWARMGWEDDAQSLSPVEPVVDSLVAPIRRRSLIQQVGDDVVHRLHIVCLQDAPCMPSP
jgi:hypothetical protein